MFRKDLVHLNDIVLAIDSVDDTLYFSDFKKFRQAIRLIDFDLDRGSFGNGFQYHCTGIINGLYVSLNFYEFDNSIKLLHKIYSNTDMFRKVHRTDDLPASMEYSDEGQLTKVVYYLNGVEFRANNQPLFIGYQFDTIQRKEGQYFRYFPVFDYNQPNYSLYSMTISGGDIIECNFCYNNELIELAQIIEFIPIVKNFKHEELMNIRKFLSKEDLSLLDMALI